MDVIEGEDKQRFYLKHNMRDRFLTIIPRCFFIPPNEQVELLVRFNPPCRVNTFTLPIRAYVGGGESTVAVVRARAANPAAGKHITLSHSTPPHSYLSSLTSTLIFICPH